MTSATVAVDANGSGKIAKNTTTNVDVLSAPFCAFPETDIIERSVLTLLFDGKGTCRLRKNTSRRHCWSCNPWVCKDASRYRNSNTKVRSGDTQTSSTRRRPKRTLATTDTNVNSAQKSSEILDLPSCSNTHATGFIDRKNTTDTVSIEFTSKNSKSHAGNYHNNSRSNTKNTWHNRNPVADKNCKFSGRQRNGCFQFVSPSKETLPPPLPILPPAVAAAYTNSGNRQISTSAISEASTRLPVSVAATKAATRSTDTPGK